MIAFLKPLIIGGFISGIGLLANFIYFLYYYSHPHPLMGHPNLIGMGQFYIVFGICTSALIAFGIAKKTDNRWLPLFYIGMIIYWVAFVLLLSLGAYLMILSLPLGCFSLVMMFFSLKTKSVSDPARRGDS